MFSSVKKPVGNDRGELLAAIIAFIVAGLVCFGLIRIGGQLIKIAYLRMAESRYNPVSISAAETMLMALRFAEMRYYDAVYNDPAFAGTANPFVVALSQGTGFASQDIPLFTTSGCSGDPFCQDPGAQSDTGSLGTYPPIYSFNTSCTIKAASSTCLDANGHAPAGGPLEIIDSQFSINSPIVTGPTLASTFPTVRFSLVSANAATGAVEFSANYVDAISTNSSGEISAAYTGRFNFAIRRSLSNSAHLESGNGIVTQDNPDPLALCPGAPFSTMFVFDKTTNQCLQFGVLGGGTGLAYYSWEDPHYFGLRSWDGTIVDLTALAVGPTYTVDPATGKTDPTKDPIFPLYDTGNLTNADDITVIGSKINSGNSVINGPQIYFVKFGGPNAVIGALDPTNPANTPINICQVGNANQQGGQQNIGIAALSDSDPLIAMAGDGIGSLRLATFFLKTDPGAPWIVFAMSSDGNPLNPYKCIAVRDPYLTQDEQDYWKRTLGFDRTESTKPYYLY